MPSSLRPRRNMRLSANCDAHGYCTNAFLRNFVPSQAFNGIIAPACINPHCVGLPPTGIGLPPPSQCGHLLHISTNIVLELKSTTLSLPIHR